MGFSGYYQILCKNMHSSEVDCYDEPNFDEPELIIPDDDMVFDDDEYPRWRCFKCKEPAVWWNMVNTTNGSYYEDERIDNYVKLEVATTPDVCTCECGHTHTKGGELCTYKLPSGVGHTTNNKPKEQT